MSAPHADFPAKVINRGRNRGLPLHVQSHGLGKSGVVSGAAEAHVLRAGRDATCSGTFTIPAV